ncbi:hypothetical protein DFH07DRAFT_782346 [Mycena maculata]|uniref:Uncharacterized protein n=1 Tax=Mycena maculata TaxID=230809 RepID=A0AAD7MRM3_9AGAR|nr:hypothetical protein DFH07DRAFT_782346 [Mycena maculata]
MPEPRVEDHWQQAESPERAWFSLTANSGCSPASSPPSAPMEKTPSAHGIKGHGERDLFHDRLLASVLRRERAQRLLIAQAEEQRRQQEISPAERQRFRCRLVMEKLEPGRSYARFFKDNLPASEEAKWLLLNHYQDYLRWMITGIQAELLLALAISQGTSYSLLAALAAAFTKDLHTAEMSTDSEPIESQSQSQSCSCNENTGYTCDNCIATLRALISQAGEALEDILAGRRTRCVETRLRTRQATGPHSLARSDAALRRINRDIQRAIRRYHTVQEAMMGMGCRIFKAVFQIIYLSLNAYDGPSSYERIF